MKFNTKKLSDWVPAILVSLFIAPGAVMKLISHPALVELFSKTSLLPFIKVLGFAELTFLILFLWQRTFKTGFLLLPGYFGGAMAVELSQGNFFLMPAFILSVIWIAAFLRDASVFSSVKKHQIPVMSAR